MKLVRSLAIALSCLAPACLVLDDGPKSSTSRSPTDPTVKDVAALEKLRDQLEEGRTVALDKGAGELDARGNVLFYRTYPGYSPALHRLDRDGKKITYEFSIGAGDDANVRLTEAAVATAQRQGSHVAYRVYDASTTGSLLGSTEFPAPGGEEKWSAYALAGTTLYVVTTPTDKIAGHTVWSLVPGGVAQKLFTLEEAGIKVGEFLDFDVEGSTLVLIESGRLWAVDVNNKRAKFLQNKWEISGSVYFSADGVVWEDAKGLKYLPYATNEVRDVSQEIAGSDFKINATYAKAHYFDHATSHENFTRYKNAVVYTGNQGIFAYDLERKRVAPVLLDVAKDDGTRVDYRYPVVLDDGTAFFVGLTSEDGAVGADGPVYRKNIAAIVAGAT